MTPQLRLWAYGPFEILVHAETHYLAGDDLDRRISMIGFDNAIELSITTYLNLHPMQRGGREYKKDDVEKWNNNFHSKVEFFFEECKCRNVVPTAKQDEILWFHAARNEQYHVGGPSVPQQSVLEGVRGAALEVFSVLFDQQDTLLLIEDHISKINPSPQPYTREHSKLIDSEYDMVEVCGQLEYASEVLYALDPNRYWEMAQDIEIEPNATDEEGIGP